MMKFIKYPGKARWKELTQRPGEQQSAIGDTVRNILSSTKKNGDKSLFDYCKQFDNVTLNNLTVSKDDLRNAGKKVGEDLKSSIRLAKNNIEKFHKARLTESTTTEPTKGVACWTQSIPIDKVGLYVPGGSAPLFSTVLMLGIPATLAGCNQIVLCSPPQRTGTIHPYILFTAGLLGIEKIYKIGGAQAVAAMAYGTETVPAVHKILGPGNSWVTEAKKLVQLDGTAIDMPAGPSEQLIIADDSSNPAFMAADLLSQSEHGPDSQVVLLSNDPAVINQTLAEVEAQLRELPRKEIARKSLTHSFAVLLNTLDECIDFSNCYAPEHLILATEKEGRLIPKIINAGSVFIGNYSPESAGDYASGTNHTLPTGGCAKSYSGISVDSFMKTITFQKISADGIRHIGPAIEQLATAEGLEGHKKAVTLRLNKLKNG